MRWLINGLLSGSILYAVLFFFFFCLFVCLFLLLLLLLLLFLTDIPICVSGYARIQSWMSPSKKLRDERANFSDETDKTIAYQLAFSSLRTKLDICANSVDPDKTAHND